MSHAGLSSFLFVCLDDQSLNFHPDFLKESGQCVTSLYLTNTINNKNQITYINHITASDLCLPNTSNF